MRQVRARLAMALLIAGGVLNLNQTVLADERTDARREFRAGMQAIGDGKYDEGVDHLERAYDILPHPNVLYNIGLAHMYAGRSEQAVEYFERYRETAPASDAIEVDSLIRSLQEVKPAPSESTAVAEGGGTNLQSGAELSDDETLAALEGAAREVRRLADEQNNEVVRKQADDLDRALAKLRERKAAAQSAQAAVSTPKETQPSEQASLAKPASTLPPKARGTERTGIYEEQVVSASRFAQSPLDAPNATAIITAQDIRMSGQTSVANLLRRIAGVEVNTVAPSHSEVSIRGLNRRAGTKILLLWDGRPIRKDFMGANWIEALPIWLEEVERIEIIRGPASALYGADAFSGIINIISKTPGTGKSFAMGRVGNMDQGSAGASFVGREGNAAWRFGTAYAQQNNTVLISDPRRVDVVPFTDTPNRANMTLTTSGQLDYTYAERGVVTVGGSLGAADTVTQGLSRVAQITSDNSYEASAFASITTPVGIRLGTWWNHIWANAGTSYQVPGAVNRSGYPLKIHQSEVDLSWSDTVKLLVPQTLTLGSTYRFKQIDWPWLGEDKHVQHHIGGYLQDVLQLANPLRLQVGARVDRHPLLPKVQFSPRGSLVYRFLGEQSIRVSAGRAFRTPSFLESYLFVPNETPLRGVTAWGIGNENLDPEGITSVELGYQNQQSDFFALEANVYYNWVKDAILLTNVDRYTLRDFAGPDALSKYVQDVAAYPVSQLSFANERATYRQLGGELGVRLFPVQGFDIYTNYSIHNTEPTDKKKVDAERANEQQTSLHKVNAGVQYRARFGMELSADLSWLSKQIWLEQVTDTERGVRWQAYKVDPLVYLSARLGWRLFKERLDLGVTGNNLLFQHKQQHPFGQKLDTRVLASAKVWF